MGKLNLNTAESTRVKLTQKQQKEIQRLYKRVAKNIAKEAEKLPNTTSGTLRKQYLEKLGKQINDQLASIQKEVEQSIESSMSPVAKKVVEDNLSWLKSIGMPISGGFSHVPAEVVKSVITGQVYSGNWSLSKAIWNTTKKTQDDVNKIVAEGIAQNKSAYDIAKDLEKYVDPSAKKSWDWSKVYPGTNKKVDYNAQRLARTLVSHAYQQAFVKTTQKNPFVTKYKWLGSNSHRICPICEARNGKLFEKDELPLDHPNGMCTFVAVIDDSMEDIADRLANWAKGGSDPALDEYAKSINPNFDLKSVKDQSTKSTSSKSSKKSTKPSTKDSSSESKDKTTSKKPSSTGKTPTLSSKILDSLFNSQKDDTVFRADAEKWWKGLTKGEKSAVRSYTNKAYIWMNKSLRGGTTADLTPKRTDTLKALQNALSKYSTTQDMVVRRGSNLGALSSMLRVDPRILTSYPQKFKGSVIQDKGFMSTSPISGGGFEGQVDYKILIPKGSQAPYIAKYSKYQNEKEVLVNSGGVFRIIDMDSEGEKVTVYMEYLGSV